MAGIMVVFASCLACLLTPGQTRFLTGDTVTHSQQTWTRVYRVLADYPVIDGHNDFPMGIRELLHNDMDRLHFDQDLRQQEPWASYWANHCDLPRMQAGQMGGQFWSAFVSCRAQFADAVQLFLEQIDIIKQLVDRWEISKLKCDQAFQICCHPFKLFSNNKFKFSTRKNGMNSGFSKKYLNLPRLTNQY